MDQYDVKRLGMILAIQAEIEGMKAENWSRKQDKHANAYSDKDFCAKAEELQRILETYDDEECPHEQYYRGVLNEVIQRLDAGSHSELNDGLNALVGLANELEKEGDFLLNPNDDIADRMCGKVYKECADRIRKTLEETPLPEKTETEGKKSSVEGRVMPPYLTFDTQKKVV